MDTGLFCDLATAAVNRFVEHYKLEAGLSASAVAYIPKITSKIIMEFKVVTMVENDRQLYIEKYYDQHGIIMGIMPEEVAIKLKGILATDKEPDLIETYKLQIENQLGINNWRNAAIDSAVLFESWLTLLIKQIYKYRGLNSAEIKRKFSIGEERRPMAISDIVNVLIPDSMELDFSGSDLGKNLLTNVFTLRNHIVHGRRYHVTKAQAELSYSTVQDAMVFLGTQFPKKEHVTES